MNLTDHFTLDEAVFSQTAVRLGLDNTPPPEVLEVMHHTAAQMEKVRFLLGFPIIVTSWYRSPKVNEAIGSKSTSQHIKGEAVDFICPKFGDAHFICKYIEENSVLIRYDQLILEGTWVHISFLGIPNSIPRREVLTFMKDRSYRRGLYESREV